MSQLPLDFDFAVKFDVFKLYNMIPWICQFRSAGECIKGKEEYGFVKTDRTYYR